MFFRSFSARLALAYLVPARGLQVPVSAAKQLLKHRPLMPSPVAPALKSWRRVPLGLSGMERAWLARLARLLRRWLERAAVLGAMERERAS